MNDFNEVFNNVPPDVSAEAWAIRTAAALQVMANPMGEPMPQEVLVELMRGLIGRAPTSLLEDAVTFGNMVAGEIENDQY